MIGASRPPRHARTLAFTLIELLAGMALFMLVIGLLLTAVNQSSKVWQKARNQVDSYQGARFAFDLITRTLSQSTLNVYGGYDDPNAPTAYIRKSDLHFVIDAPPAPSFGQGNAIFFQAPIGRTGNSASFGNLPGILNSVGYYVTYGKNPALPPFLAKLDRNRFRLMQFLDPSENLAVYQSSGKQWYSTALSSRSNVIANNVILFLAWPRVSTEEDEIGNSLTSDYLYDSRLPAAPAPQRTTTNQQPPLVDLTLVAIDEVAANRLDDSSTPPSPVTGALSGLFSTPTEAAYKEDLQTLESRLASANIGYRVFHSTVPLRESKWNKPQ